jgi:RimJ/RimL family protein N-acetyltransferase
MLTLQKSTIHQLTVLLNKNEYEKNEQIAPSFLLEFSIDKLTQDSNNAFWWTPRLIVVHKLIVGMCGFKNIPVDNSVEIGYGIIPSQQKQGFATHAVELLLKEAFSKIEIKSVVAHTVLSNKASQRVLEKNSFIKEGSKIDSDGDEVFIWRKRKEIKRDK